MKAKTISKLTVHSHYCKIIFPCKNLYFVNEEIWAGCPKLGHAIPAIVILIRGNCDKNITPTVQYNRVIVEKKIKVTKKLDYLKQKIYVFD